MVNILVVLFCWFILGDEDSVVVRIEEEAGDEEEGEAEDEMRVTPLLPAHDSGSKHSRMKVRDVSPLQYPATRGVGGGGGQGALKIRLTLGIHKEYSFLSHWCI